MHMVRAFALLFILPVMGSSLAQAAIYNVSSSMDLQAKLNTVVAGDEIIVANGTYTGPFNINGNSGTATKPITLRAQNRHKAVIQGNGNDLDGNNEAFEIHRPYWIIEGFDIRDHQVPIYIDTTHTEVRHNLIHDFTRFGLWVREGSEHFFHHNIIGRCRCFSSDNSWAGIELDNSSSRNKIQENIFYSITNNAFVSVGGSYNTNGYPILGTYNNDDNLIQGNIMMDGAKNTGFRFSGSGGIVGDSSAPQADRNIFRDNIIAHGQGGGVGLGENVADTLVTNNISYGILFAAANNKGNPIGRNKYIHNTIVMTAYSQYGLLFEPDDSGVSSVNDTVKDNLFYSTVAAPAHGQFLNVYYWDLTIAESNYNLFWRPGDPSTWGVPQFGPNDIHSQSQKPVFVNEAAGDFTLASGSPGKGSASDGSDRGATFNQYLKKSWMQKVATLPSQEKNTDGATSLSFSTNPANWYQVFAYIPDSNYYGGSESFYVEGQTAGAINIQRDAIDDTWAVQAPPQRYIYLGTYTNNGTLNVSWQHANAASKVLIRQMPTPQEAYSWMTQDTEAYIPPAPTNLRIVSP